MDARQPPAAIPGRRGSRARVAQPLQLATWLGATFRVLATRAWVWLPLGALAVLVVAPVAQLYMPIWLHPLPWWWDRGTPWPSLLLGFVPPTLVVTLAALLVPDALRGGRWPRRGAWWQAAVRLPLVYLAVVALAAPAWLPVLLLTWVLRPLSWILLVVVFVLQARCSLAPVILLTKRTGLLRSFRASVLLTRHHTPLLVGGYFLLAVLVVVLALLLGRWTRFGIVTISGHERPVLIAAAIMQSAYLGLYAFASAVAWHDLDAPSRRREADALAQVFD